MKGVLIGTLHWIYSLTPLRCEDKRNFRLSHCSLNHSIIGCLLIYKNSWFGLVESENTLISAFSTLNFLLCSSE